ncbi:thioredoxin domain-containing protein 12 [Bombus fervidus]|uniref:thioredoxin domain-containing protein 12 n=1 Tax=Bombus fervidus TaxID=203811 RepID=UPI003AB6BE0E
MNKWIKFFSAINLIALANQIVENNLLNIGDSNCDKSFERLFKWRSVTYGFQEAKVVNKPIFLLIHKMQCPSCQKLKQKFSNSVRLMDLSDRFVMVKAEMGYDAALDDDKFQPDGKYVPRILFFTSNGDFIEEAYNNHADADKEYKFFYKNPSEIINTMLLVLKNYSKEPLRVIFQYEELLHLETCDMEDDILVPTLLH